MPVNSNYKFCKLSQDANVMRDWNPFTKTRTYVLKPYGNEKVTSYYRIKKGTESDLSTNYKWAVVVAEKPRRLNIGTTTWFPTTFPLRPDTRYWAGVTQADITIHEWIELTAPFDAKCVLLNLEYKNIQGADLDHINNFA